jgi:hypothetical protein
MQIRAEDYIGSPYRESWNNGTFSASQWEIFNPRKNVETKMDSYVS